MLISDYLNNPKLKLIEQLAIEDKDNFTAHRNAAAELLFGKGVHKRMWSNAKILREGVLADPALNKQGLHLFRYAFSTYAAMHRSNHPEFLNNGHVRVNNFLPTDKHLLVQSECNTFPICINKQGFNNCHRHSNANPGIEYLLNTSGMEKIITDCLGIDTPETTALYKKNTFVQRVENIPNDGDEQKDIHSDIFFPAAKWWYFPDKVELGDGPFRFQTSAPKYDHLFWDWLYRESVDITAGSWDQDKRRGHIEGSFRVTQQELLDMNVTVSPITVEANTLVVANVQLFHGRGDSTRAHVRNAIHGSIRVKFPFLVL
tara:strand:+ start:4489 stop:5436 length:948 start_codon:yes stop_codon:yes gene_type:complete